MNCVIMGMETDVRAACKGYHFCDSRLEGFEPSAAAGRA